MIWLPVEPTLSSDSLQTYEARGVLYLCCQFLSSVVPAMATFCFTEPQAQLESSSVARLNTLVDSDLLSLSLLLFLL